jgi:hypothetical protein
MLGEKTDRTVSDDKFIQKFIDGLEKPRLYSVADLFRLWSDYALDGGYPQGQTPATFTRLLYKHTNVVSHRPRIDGKQVKSVWIR